MGAREDLKNFAYKISLMSKDFPNRSLLVANETGIVVTPDENNVTNNGGLGKARANKRQSFDSGEEGLKGMDNQSKIVPYCPSY